jgi:hypothetical protein
VMHCVSSLIIFWQQTFNHTVAEVLKPFYILHRRVFAYERDN